MPVATAMSCDVCVPDGIAGPERTQAAPDGSAAVGGRQLLALYGRGAA
jgi:hypothetical protein